MELKNINGLIWHYKIENGTSRYGNNSIEKIIISNNQRFRDMGIANSQFNYRKEYLKHQQQVKEICEKYSDILSKIEKSGLYQTVLKAYKIEKDSIGMVNYVYNITDNSEIVSQEFIFDAYKDAKVLSCTSTVFLGRSIHINSLDFSNADSLKKVFYEKSRIYDDPYYIGQIIPGKTEIKFEISPYETDNPDGFYIDNIHMKEKTDLRIHDKLLKLPPISFDRVRIDNAYLITHIALKAETSKFTNIVSSDMKLICDNVKFFNCAIFKLNLNGTDYPNVKNLIVKNGKIEKYENF